MLLFAPNTLQVPYLPMYLDSGFIPLHNSAVSRFPGTGPTWEPQVRPGSPRPCNRSFTYYDRVVGIAVQHCHCGATHWVMASLQQPQLGDIPDQQVSMHGDM